MSRLFTKLSESLQARHGLVFAAGAAAPSSASSRLEESAIAAPAEAGPPTMLRASATAFVPRTAESVANAKVTEAADTKAVESDRVPGIEASSDGSTYNAVPSAVLPPIAIVPPRAETPPGVDAPRSPETPPDPVVPPSATVPPGAEAPKGSDAPSGAVAPPSAAVPPTTIVRTSEDAQPDVDASQGAQTPPSAIVPPKAVLPPRVEPTAEEVDDVEDDVQEPIPPTRDPEEDGSDGPEPPIEDNGPDTPTQGMPLDQTSAVSGGRVTTFELGDDVNAVRILEKPDVGNVTVNPDNTVALVLTGTTYSGPLSFSLEVTHGNGTTEVIEHSLTVEPLQQLQGWATGENSYMLETDDDGDLIVEHGDNHRVVHMSGSDTALSKADIAALEGLAEADISVKWLLDHPEYGATPDMALDADLGADLWRWGLTGNSNPPGSHWLLMERGYQYSETLVRSGTTGESELHPIYIGAYGEGEPPLINKEQKMMADPSSNVVIENLEFTGRFSIFNNKNILLNELVFDGDKLSAQGIGQDILGLTIRNSTIHDVVRDAPIKDVWSTADRTSGLFVRQTDGLLIEGLHVDQSGWEDDYSYDGDPAFGQAPNNMSQNIYIQRDVSDITFRDNISMRGASFGAQVRPGGFIEDNVFVDNNAALGAYGGIPDSDGVRTGHFTFAADNLVTSAGAKEVYAAQGALSFGINTLGISDTLLDNLVAHLSDPNNPDEFAAKSGNGSAVNNPKHTSYFDDTIVYNWIAQNFSSSRLAQNADRNTEGVDPNLADQTTIQNFTAALLGQSSATIDDLGEFLRTQVADDLPNTVTADDIIAYFQAGFGMYSAPRAEAETLRFVPYDLGDGVRWDNRVNWTTEDLPGTVKGDSVDLGGNWVNFATITATIEDLDFGSDGRLTVSSGKLAVDGTTSAGPDGAEVAISGAGQFWLNGYSDPDTLAIEITAGRFANTGDFDGTADISISDGQAILATSGAGMTLGAGSRLSITGDEARVGFDGEDGGIATLKFHGGRLDFVADATGFAGIREFRSGAFGDEPDVLSGIDMGNGVLGIDITALNGAALEDVLLGADEILGSFNTIELIGLADTQDASITFNYETDEVTFKVTEIGTGTGQMTTAFAGDMMDAQESGDLWAALTEGQGTYSETEEPEIDEDDEFSSAVA